MPSLGFSAANNKMQEIIEPALMTIKTYDAYWQTNVCLVLPYAYLDFWKSSENHVRELWVMSSQIRLPDAVHQHYLRPCQGL